MADQDIDRQLHVVRSESTRRRQPPGVLSTLVLRPLDDPTMVVRFDTFESEDDARTLRGDTYRLILGVTGPWIAPPTHAVCAEWRVADPARAEAFVESRRQLFELRREVLPTFALDWLLEHLDHEGQYMVLGLYGDEEGATRLSREHPDIQQFASEHPVAEYTATDLTGVRCFTVERRMPILIR